jgi:hypothetical protein
MAAPGQAGAAKTVDGVSRLPRKLSLKAIFRGG